MLIHVKHVIAKHFVYENFPFPKQKEAYSPITCLCQCPHCSSPDSSLSRPFKATKVMKKSASTQTAAG